MLFICNSNVPKQPLFLFPKSGSPKWTEKMLDRYLWVIHGAFFFSTVILNYDFISHNNLIYMTAETKF